MSEDVRAMLAREAEEAEAAAEAEERGEAPPRPGQRARRSKDASQVYSLRLPAEAIAQLKSLGKQLDEAPTALLRRFVLERLAQEAARAQRQADPLAAAVEELLPLLRARLTEAGAQVLQPARAPAATQPPDYPREVNIGGSRRASASTRRLTLAGETA